jgi:nitrogen regulatory protein PII
MHTKASIYPHVACLLFFLFLLHTGNAVTHADEPEYIEREQNLKAAFLVNFARFTRWPEGRENRHTPFIFLNTLNEIEGRGFKAISHAHVRGHNIEVRFSEKNQIDTTMTPPDLIFITNTSYQELEKILKWLEGKPVLTVSDILGFTSYGGMIELIRKKDSIHFNINYKSVKKAGLEMNYQMLKLADKVFADEK